MLFKKYISIFNCLVRSDYNLVIGLICYFFWQNRENRLKNVSLITLLVLIITTIFDLLFILIVWKSWTSFNVPSKIWQHMEFLHITVLITSIINMVLKVLAAVFIKNEEKLIESNKYEQLH